MQDIVLKMYFEEKKKQIEIANILSISKYKVSRILTKDARYKQEKENRKKENKQKHIENTKRYMKIKREKQYEEAEILKLVHNQAIMELSDGNKLCNRAFRKWNSSAYKYNVKKKCYVFNRKLNGTYSVPKIIK